MRENFIYARTKNAFLQQLNAGNIIEDAIVFIEDSQEVWTHGMYFGVDLREYYNKEEISNLVAPFALKTSIPTKVSQLTNDKEYATLDDVANAINLTTSRQGFTQVNSLTKVPVNKEIVIALINQSQSFSLASVPGEGSSLHILIKNTGSTNITITIPNSGIYVNTNNSTQLTISAGNWCEINVLSDGGTAYIRGV